MGQKKTPALVTKAKRLRAEGRSNGEIAAELSKNGTKVSEASIRNWLGPPAPPPTAPAAHSPATPPGHAAAPPVAPTEPDDAEMTPAEFTAWLTGQMRAAKTAAETCRFNGDQVGAQRATRLAVQLAALLQKQHARRDDEGDTVRVRVADMQASAERAVLGLHQIAERVVAERARWPRCPTCGQPAGEFPPTDKSPIRALVERVFGRLP